MSHPLFPAKPPAMRMASPPPTAPMVAKAQTQVVAVTPRGDEPPALEDILAYHKLPLTPTGEVFTLTQDQVDCINTCIWYDRCGIFMPVGTGKTVIGTLVALSHDGVEHYIVLVLPILVAQWVEWLNSVGNSGKAVAYEGGPKKRKDIDLPKFRWWVMSYGIFRNDFAKLVALLKDKEHLTLFDEQHNIKNSASKTFQLVYQLTSGHKFIGMTGTELNNPIDAYAYIKMKTPTIYSNKAHFERVHVATYDFFEQPEEWTGLDLMNANLYLQSFKRTKAQISRDKPNIYPVTYHLHPEHKALYDQVIEEQLVELEEQGKLIDASTPQLLYNISQQLVMNWAHFSGRPDVRPAAFDVLDNIVEEIDLGEKGSSKLIIWTWFKLSTRLIRDYMQEVVAKRLKIDGKRGVAVCFSESNSVKEIERFMKDPQCLVLVGQPGSAGAGLNPQYICWEMIFLETPTIPIPFTQAAGRIDRLGQKYTPNIRVGQAIDTCQLSLWNKLMKKDELVVKVEGGRAALREMLLHGAVVR